jgi:dGTPase
MNEIFYILKQEYNGTGTIRNIKKLKRYYPVLSQEFATWLETYSNCDERDEEKYFNKIIYDLNNPKEYSRAIIDYMSGMTDQYIVRTYNEIISF